MSTTLSQPTIRDARATDTDAFIALVSLIDLRIPASDVPQQLAPVREELAEEPSPPLSHGLNLFMVAEDAQGTPVGAIACGPPLWIIEHPRVHRFMQNILARRISTIHALAVHPDHRRQGIGRGLLRVAEEKFTQANYTVLTLRHAGLQDYYGPLGYTSVPQLVMDLPPLGQITQRNKGWSHAVKPLRPEVSLTTVHGNPVPVVTGTLAARYAEHAVPMNTAL